MWVVCAQSGVAPTYVDKKHFYTERLILFQVCRGRKNTLDEFATSRCTLWSKSLSGVTLVGPGRRFKQEPSIGSWISCAIFCETDKKQWYSPRRELGTEAFYPDGIWCHRDSKDADYYCQKNLCLPQQYEVNEAARMAADAEKEMSGEDNFIIDEAEGVVTIVSYNADIAP